MTWRADLPAALLAAVLVLPQGIAFATLAGLPPAWGLYSAIVPTIVAALAGSSRHVLTGPTNALSIALAAALAPLATAGSAEWLRLALVLTLMVGLIQLGVAVLRLGSLTHFIAPSVLMGFTTGAAGLIAWHALQALAPTGAHPAQWAVAGVTLAVAVAVRWRWPRAPALLLALVCGTLVSLWPPWLTGAGLARVGELPQAWPEWAMVPVQGADWAELSSIALALTLVALGQSVAIAKVLAARSGHELDVNREVFGQGLANTVGAFFQAFASCGSLNRSAPHLEAGARTPLAGVMAGLGVLALVALAAPALALVPMAAIQALLLVVAWTLVDRAGWRSLWRIDRPDAAIAAGTMLATWVLPLQVAVLAGVAASLVLYLHRTAHPALRHMGFAAPPGDAAGPDGAPAARPFVVLQPGAAECPQLTLLRMEGPVWFGAESHVADALKALRHRASPAPHLLVMSKSMNFLDAAGVALWEHERQAREAMGGGLYFHRPRPPVMEIWRRSGFLDRLGEGRLFADKHSAIAALVPRLDGSRCATCQSRIFQECARQPGGPAAGEGTAHGGGSDPGR